MQARRTAAIIDFPLDRVRPPRGGSAASAEVLIFTGVRIERMYDLAERLPPAPRSGYASNARMDIDFW